MNVRFYSNLKFKLNDDDIYSPDNEKEKNKSEKQIMTPMRLILNYRDGRLFLRFFVTKNNISILKDENMDEVCQFVKNTIAWLGKKT